MGKFAILTCANIVFGYAALVIVLRGVIDLPLFDAYFAQMIELLGPIPLFITAVWSAVLLWQVRQVSNLRIVDLPDVSDALARGQHDPIRLASDTPTAPELLARSLVWFAIFALPIWLGWPLPILWPVMLYGLWGLIRCAL